MSIKRIYDNIHGYIKIGKLAIQIIDTMEYQRLRGIKQLGCGYFVFPCAEHSRFVHSVGTYHLAGVLLNNLKNKQPELNIDDRTMELVKIAGLCHDLGHCCFSHAFDDEFLCKTMPDNPYRFHEHRSNVLFEHMVYKYNLKISKKEIKFIQNLINPRKEDTGFLYQIISNSLNSIDLDKFDYITRDTYNIGLKYGFEYQRIIEEARVIDGNICFPQKMSYDVQQLFSVRYRLHKQIYTHPVVIAVEYMIRDILFLADEELKITEKAQDIEGMCQLTDSLLDRIQFHPTLFKAKKLINRLHRRQLYHYFGEITVPNKSVVFDIEKYFPDIDKNEIIVHRTCIGYISGNKANPLDNIFYYNKTDKNTSFKINIKEVSPLLSEDFQETSLRLYLKNYTNIEKDYVNKQFKILKNSI
jgi:HD superfamily phosphohydrolase